MNWIILILFLWVNLFTGCRNHEKYFVMTVSKGGGFSALYNGCELRRDGLIIEWKQFGNSQREKLGEKRVSPEEIRKIADQLLTLKMVGQTSGVRGNITHRVAYADLYDTLSWTWSTMPVVDSGWEEWYLKTRKFCIDQAL